MEAINENPKVYYSIVAVVCIIGFLFYIFNPTPEEYIKCEGAECVATVNEFVPPPQ